MVLIIRRRSILRNISIVRRVISSEIGIHIDVVWVILLNLHIIFGMMCLVIISMLSAVCQHVSWVVVLLINHI